MVNYCGIILFNFPDYFLKTEKKMNKVKPEDNGERECESWREVADSRSESRRTVFYTLTSSYLRHEPVPYKLTTQKPESPFNQDTGV